MNNIVLLILDSCRYDSFIKAKTDNFEKIGKPEKRYSYASWTAPSHYNFLNGIMPHTSPTNVYASKEYRKDFLMWKERTGKKDFDFKKFIPYLSLAKVMKELGYITIARVSLPVLNEQTLLPKYFDDWKLMNDHNDFAGMVEEARFDANVNSFYLFNIGETHFPYKVPGDDTSDLPYISGVHGIFKHMDDFLNDPNKFLKQRKEVGFPEKEMLKQLRARQIRAVEYCNKLFQKLYKKATENTYFIITADHGELFGEKGYFGHGPIMHKKVFEVPYIEGLKK